MSRELVILELTDNGVECSKPDFHIVDYKAFKYLKNYINGYLVFDMLEEYHNEVVLVNQNKIMMPYQTLLTFMTMIHIIDDALEKVQGKMQREIWKTSNMLTLRIKTKPTTPRIYPSS
jgi:hypothetical protein